MKKITAILLSALLVLSLAGCGNNSQNTAGDVSTETETAVQKKAQRNQRMLKQQTMERRILKLRGQRMPETVIF